MPSPSLRLPQRPLLKQQRSADRWHTAMWVSWICTIIVINLCGRPLGGYGHSWPFLIIIPMMLASLVVAIVATRKKVGYRSWIKVSLIDNETHRAPYERS